MERIAKGVGTIDAVSDVVALVTLYRQHPVLAGGPVVTAALLDEAELLGTSLLDELTPKAAAPKPQEKDAELSRLTDDRNAFWTLLQLSYAELTRVADFLRVEVPTLQRRRPKVKAVAHAAASAGS